MADRKMLAVADAEVVAWDSLLRATLRKYGTDPYAEFQKTYWADPVGFVHRCLRWEHGENSTVYQDELMAGLMGNKRESVRSPHGTGKTAVAAWLVLWFSLTRDGQDWKTITTASAWRQLREYLWPEVHKWAKRIRWDRVGRPAFDEQRELLKLNLTLSTGSAFAVASDNAAWIEGAHADHLLYIFDEAKVIPGTTWDAVEGAFSTPGEVLAFSISTPGEPNGRFYDIQSRKPGYEDWHVRHIRLDEALAARRMSEDWVNQRRLQWGEQAAVYQNRVLGEFASSEEDGVIPLAWVEMAVERWHENHDGDFTGVGVDVARGGADKSCLALRHGNVIAELRYYSKEDTMAISGRVAGILKEHGGWASVDVIGVGAGVVDRLAEEGYDVEAYNAAERTDRKDRSGELGFVNRRSAGWWTLRELLDPANGEGIALPPDDLLIGDLTAPKWRVVSGGRIQIESKDDIRKRLGRSTDAGDSVMQAFDHDVMDSRLPYSWMLRGAK